MEQNTMSAWEKLLPRQRVCLTLYWSGLPKWKAAKRSGYKGKSKSALAHTCTDIIKKYGSEADTQEILDRCGLDKVSWARNVLWLIRHAKAKHNLKVLSTGLKLHGEARHILRHIDDEGEKGASINIVVSKEDKPKLDERKKAVQAGKVFRIPVSED